MIRPLNQLEIYGFVPREYRLLTLSVKSFVICGSILVQVKYQAFSDVVFHTKMLKCFHKYWPLTLCLQKCIDLIPVGYGEKLNTSPLRR